MASFLVHVAIFAALLAIPAGVVRRAERKQHTDVVFYRRPQPETPPPIVRSEVPPKPPEAPTKKPAVKPRAVEPPRPAPAPRSEPPPPPRVERRAPPAPEPAPPVVAAQPEPPRPKVRTDVFRDTAAPTAQVTAPRTRQTRTGTFTASAGPASQPPAPARASTHVGGFEASAAPAAAEAPRERRVTTAGFGEAVAPAEPGAARSGNRDVKQGQFGDGVVAAAAPRPKGPAAAAAELPVEIISKPKPSYTDEARRLKVEGEVVLEVIFVSSGQLKVLGVVRSLGHGLDEAAIEAARSIEFKPARRNGQPVDHAATIHIVFQLA